MPREPVFTPDAPVPSGSYSQGMRVGDLLFLAGQGPFDASGQRAGESVRDQTRQVLANLDAVARAAGGSLKEAVRVNAYLSSLAHFDDYDATYREFFEEPFPARATVQSDLPDFDVEIEAVVWLGD